MAGDHLEGVAEVLKVKPLTLLHTSASGNACPAECTMIACICT